MPPPTAEGGRSGRFHRPRKVLSRLSLVRVIEARRRIASRGCGSLSEMRDEVPTSQKSFNYSRVRASFRLLQASLTTSLGRREGYSGRGNASFNRRRAVFDHISQGRT